MVYFSNREAEIIFLLLRQDTGLTREDLSKNLNVSRRTIYRELSSLESTLARVQIQLLKQQNRYRLVGEPAALKKLKQQITTAEHPEYFDVHRRQSAETCRLLLRDQVITMKQLADEFGVSVPTISQDLTAIETILTDYRLQLARKKAQGVQVTGKESNLRRVLSGVLNSEINEYEFFEYLEQRHLSVTETEYSSRYFIKLLEPTLLATSYQAIKKYQRQSLSQFSDSQLQQLIIVLTISAMRIAAKQTLNELKHVDKNELFKYQQVAIDIFNQFPASIRDHVNLLELEFLALQIQGMSFALPKNVLLENYDLALSYQIRELVQNVSTAFKWEFRQDDQLFTDLMAHLAAALKRSHSQLPELNNPVLQRIKTEYAQLYKIVARALKTVFPQTEFIDSEVAYVVIHFASSYEKRVKRSSLSALVVCANGIGTAKILETRLRKNIPELTKIHVSRVADLNHLDPNQYDIVLSTIVLPGFPLNYKMISPLLLESEIKEISEYLQTYYGKVEPKSTVAQPQLNERAQDFKSAYEVMKTANDILERITVQKIVNTDQDLLATLGQITTSLSGVILTEPQRIADKLLKRMQQAPVGIPDSPLALIHTTDHSIKRPFFSIYDLSTPLTITAMDGQTIALTRVLLMLGPEKMTFAENSLMGKISGSIIESDLNLAIYKTGSQQIVYQLVSSLFLDEIKYLNQQSIEKGDLE
ncbi:BglG family transcription antiterminator [Loigolactobacillus binensis]|uniref:BglG family transcription antiterminator n=1 Tax=Loigolactobacillus binensis TaxID=2559922 RepID=A0ABW3EET1_9LACO|nr:BglG family transcription antiterminator [Loigolactobacillus binensis]